MRIVRRLVDTGVGSRRLSARRGLVVGLFAWALALGAMSVSRAQAEKVDKETAKELTVAARLVASSDPRQRSLGVERLRAIRASQPLGPAAEAAAKLLREHGVGKEVDVRLIDRKVFRSRLKMTDPSVLDMVEKTLRVLRKRYEGTGAFFDECSLEVVFYDSQARFRKAGGAITSSGHFKTRHIDYAKGALGGTIEWHLPPFARTPHDRLLRMQSILYHECTHYLNAVAFGPSVPPLLEEGLATFFTSRLNVDKYQVFRINDRERLESDARNALATIETLPRFLEFLAAERGFGRGDESVDRWYALCYAVVDFFEEGEVGGKRASVDALLGRLASVAQAARSGPVRRAPPTPNSREALEEAVKALYGASLQEFHAALVKRILASYRQK